MRSGWGHRRRMIRSGDKLGRRVSCNLSPPSSFCLIEIIKMEQSFASEAGHRITERTFCSQRRLYKHIVNLEKKRLRYCRHYPTAIMDPLTQDTQNAQSVDTYPSTLPAYLRRTNQRTELCHYQIHSLSLPLRLQKILPRNPHPVPPHPHEPPTATTIPNPIPIVTPILFPL